MNNYLSYPHRASYVKKVRRGHAPFLGTSYRIRKYARLNKPHDQGRILYRSILHSIKNVFHTQDRKAS